MKPESWSRIRDAFHEALDLDEAERERYVQTLAEEEPEIAREVSALLASDASNEENDDSGFLEPPDPDVARRAIAGPDGRSPERDPWIGRMVGPFRLLERIGVGGMAAIYLAVRTREYDERVAVKLIKRGMDTDSILRRFRLERQALADLTHPNIGRLLDGGVTDDDRPYLVMEYIDGAPIDEYCDRESLDVRERLGLFVDVCSGVDYAHSRGIVHRDLKPSNVLVTRRGERAVAKIIDFGIAALLSAESDAATTLTQVGQIMGSPRYMSPEQCEATGEVDARSDVYSLGVILYQLLAGRLPYDRTPRDAEDLRRMIDTNPPVPSSRVPTTVESDEIARRRATNSAGLRRRLRGELDWITQQAMHHDRERRYPSAAALGEDVRRYLDGRSIDAAPPSLLYRANRFARRHAMPVTLVSVVFFAIVFGSIASGWWLLRADALRGERGSIARLADDVQSEIAQAHLWFEEALAGDPSIELERDVLDRIDHARSRVLGVTERAASRGRRVAGRVAAEVEIELDGLGERLDQFAELTRDRWAAPHGGGGETGGRLDQRYDGLYDLILVDCRRIREAMDTADLGDWRRSAGITLLINAGVLLLVGFLALVAVLALGRRQP